MPHHRRHSALFFAVLITIPTFSQPAPAALTTVTWSGATGDWFDPSLWSPNLVPNNTPTDQFNPIIPSGTVTLATNATVNGLSLDAPALLALASSTTLQVSGTSSLTTSGSLLLNAGSILNFQGAAYLDSCNISGDGTLVLETVPTARLYLQGVSTVSNMVIAHPALSNYAVLDGTGTLTITSSLAVDTALTSFQGTIAPNATLQIYKSFFTQRTFTNNGSAVVSGAWTAYAPVVNNNLMSLEGPSGNGSSFNDFTNNGTVSLTAYGAYALRLSNNGLITSDTRGGFTADTLLSPGTLSLNSVSRYGSLILSNGSLLTGSGSLTPYNGYNHAVFLSGAATVSNFIFADIDASASPGTLTITGASAWSSTLTSTPVKSVSLVLNPGASLAISISGYSSGAVLSNSSLLNYGSVNATSMALSNVSIINNGSFSSSGPITGTGTLTNNALWTTSRSVTLTNFINNGTLTNTGTLALAGGSSSGPIINAGSLFFSQPYTFNPGASLLATGSPSFLGSTLTLNTALPLQNTAASSFLPSSSVLTGPGSFELSGNNTWNGVTLLNLLSSKVLADGSLNLSGGTSSLLLNGSSLVNEGYIKGSLSLRNNASFINRGTFNAIGMSGDTSSSFTNDSLLTLTTFSSVPSFNTGTITIAAATTSFAQFTRLLHNAGLISVQQSYLNLLTGYVADSPNAVLQFAPDTGLLFSAGSSSDFGPNPLNLGPANLKGAGTVRAQFTTTGALLPTGTFTLTNYHAPNSLTTVGALTLPGTANAWTATLDLTDTSLLVQTTANKADVLTTLANQIASASNHGQWNANGLTSSTVAASPNVLTLALLDNADLNLPSYAGQALDANSLLILPTQIGDANLDHNVDFADYDIWYKNVGGAGSVTSRGDFNLDNQIDLSDYDAWYQHVGASFSVSPYGIPNSPIPIPEPATFTLPLIALLLCRAKRCHPHTHPVLLGYPTRRSTRRTQALSRHP